MRPHIGLSAIVITRNEEADLRGCLESLKPVASEIILVDSGSTDRTLEIAREFTDRIFHRDWTGFSAQKQFALEKTTSPWVINIDADERLSSELQTEIQRLLSAAEVPENGFDIPFHHYFLGRRLRFGGVRGESHLRLFRRAGAEYGTERVHEGVRVSPPIGRMAGAILHYSYRDIDEYLEKCNRYTTLIARAKHAEGRRFRVTDHLRLPFEFFTRYFFKGGFLDGSEGLIYAALSSYYAWIKYVKIREVGGNKQ